MLNISCYFYVCHWLLGHPRAGKDHNHYCDDDHDPIFSSVRCQLSNSWWVPTIFGSQKLFWFNVFILAFIIDISADIDLSHEYSNCRVMTVMKLGHKLIENLLAQEMIVMVPFIQAGMARFSCKNKD